MELVLQFSIFVASGVISYGAGLLVVEWLEYR